MKRSQVQARPGPFGSRDRIWGLVTALGLIAFAVFALYHRQTAIFWGGDDADYALLARALRSFRYDDLFLVGTPIHTTYPPVYPALLAVWGAVFGDGVSTLSVLNVFLMVATLGIVAHLVAVHGSARSAAVATLVLVTNPHLLTSAGRMLSEAPMMFFGASAIWLADRRTDRASVALACACAVLCVLTRTAGIAVIMGIGLHWLIQRRWTAVAALGIATLVSLGAWVLWTTQETTGPGTAYASRFAVYQFGDASFLGGMFSTLSSKIPMIFASQLPEAFALPLTSRTLLDNLVWGMLILVAGGLGLWSIRGRVRPADATLLAYALVLVIWPFAETRLLIPILPLLLVAAIAGASRAGRLVRPSLGEPFAIAMAALLIASGAWRSGQALPCDGSIYSETPECVRESDVGLGKAVTYIGGHTPGDAIVMVRRGEVLNYYTGRSTVAWPRREEAEAAPADTILAVAAADYILASRAYGRSLGLAIFLNQACARLETVFAVRPHTLVLRVHPADSPPTENACRDVREGFPPPG